jgi:DNA invertase Pin-like site-specific DNA recombinase
MAEAARKVTAKDANEKLAHRRLTVLELAERLGNVSEACRRGGIDRTSIYDWKRRCQLEGLDGVKDLPPIAKWHPRTTTPAGRMMMQMVGAFAEFERAMIRERTSAGIAAARAAGRIGGRRKKLDAVKRREIAESVITGRKSGAEMARLYNISQPTVSRIVAQHRMANL